MIRKLRARLALAAGALAFMWASPAAAQATNDRRDFWHMGDWSWGHMMFGGGLMMILFWGLIIFLVFLLAYRIWPSRDEGRTSSPRAILEERFARGEIDEEEFERRRRKLEDPNQ